MVQHQPAKNEHCQQYADNLRHKGKRLFINLRCSLEIDMMMPITSPIKIGGSATVSTVLIASCITFIIVA